MQLPDLDDKFMDPFSPYGNDMEPPKAAIFALLSVATQEEILAGAGYSESTRTEDGCHWDVYALAGRRLIHVHAESDVTYWSWEDRTTPTPTVVARAWRIAAIDAIEVTKLQIQEQPYRDIRWDAAYAVRIGDQTLHLPAGERANNQEERDRLQRFVDALVKAFDAS